MIRKVGKIPKLASPVKVLMADVRASEFNDFAGNH